MKMLTHLAAVLPEIEKASLEYETVFSAAMEKPSRIAGEEIFAAAKQYNEILKKTVEAIYQDTKHVNSRKTIFQGFSRVHEGMLTLFGHHPYEKLKRAVETDSLKNL